MTKKERNDQISKATEQISDIKQKGFDIDKLLKYAEKHDMVVAARTSKSMSRWDKTKSHEFLIYFR